MLYLPSRRFMPTLCAALALVIVVAACGAGPEEAALGETATSVTETPRDETFDIGDLLRALDIPVEVDIPELAELSSMGISIGRDETEREIYDLHIELRSDGTAGQLTDALHFDPILPDRGIDIPLPTFDYFYDWSDPRVGIEQLEAGSIGYVNASTRRQSKRAGDGVVPGPVTGPIRQLSNDVGLAMSSSSSTIRWTPDRPGEIAATVGLGGLPGNRAEVIEWLRVHAVPGTFQSSFDLSNRDDRINGTINAVLAGEPPIEVTWRGGSYRDSMIVEFSYPIDEAGLPLPTPDLAAAPERQILIRWGERWLVDDDGTVDPGWVELDFNDSKWRAANAPLVRNEPKIRGEQIATPDSGDAAWFRHGFDVAEPSEVEGFEISYVADDGILILLNGIELHRWNLPNQPIGPATLATTRVSGADEDLIRVAVDLPATAVLPGQNVLAVAVLQASTDSSDTRFDLQLEGR